MKKAALLVVFSLYLIACNKVSLKPHWVLQVPKEGVVASSNHYIHSEQIVLALSRAREELAKQKGVQVESVLLRIETSEGGEILVAGKESTRTVVKTKLIASYYHAIEQRTYVWLDSSD